MPYLEIFGLDFFKTIVIFEISTLKFIKNESLTHTVNFGIGSAFSQVLGPGPGPLYNICRMYHSLCVLVDFSSDSSFSLLTATTFSTLLFAMRSPVTSAFFVLLF